MRVHYEQKMSKMEQMMEAVLGHLNAQAQEKSRSDFDQLLDGLEGYEDVLGKGKVSQDSKHWQSRATLEQVLQVEAELYGKYGGKFDLKEAAQTAVKRLFGSREAQEAAPRNERGQFTATHKPTARAEAEKVQLVGQVGRADSKGRGKVNLVKVNQRAANSMDKWSK